MTIDEAIHKYEAMATDDELKSEQCYQKYINYQDHDYKTDSDWWRKEAAEFRRFVSLLKELEVTQTMIQRINHLPSAQPETAKRIVGKSRNGMTMWYQCDMCNEPVDANDAFCRGCGRRLTYE